MGIRRAAPMCSSWLNEPPNGSKINNNPAE
uniref:Uncharacterized protein n=1 Tax=Rhizophora mucronata TaxID=61149 RepID=A0A2P2QHL6_RHIMU